jgi:hypothetical protein
MCTLYARGDEVQLTRNIGKGLASLKINRNGAKRMRKKEEYNGEVLEKLKDAGQSFGYLGRHSQWFHHNPLKRLQAAARNAGLTGLW